MAFFFYEFGQKFIIVLLNKVVDKIFILLIILCDSIVGETVFEVLAVRNCKRI